MIRGCSLHREPLVSVIRFDHPGARPHRDPGEEIAEGHAVSFIERGSFEMRARGKAWLMDPASVFVTHPGFTYSCRHDSARPDDVSLSIHYAPDLVEDVREASGRPWPRSRPCHPLTNRLAYLRLRLLAAAGGDLPAMEVPVLAGELLSELSDGARGGGRLVRPAQLAWHARRVDAARSLLSERFAEPLSLRSVSREVGMSPFHFSRVFRELTGEPPHRYLRRIRLAHAARRLKEGEGVTDTCHACGFGNLSHFIRSFRRAFGVVPSRYAR
jgi:AraC-like DNA-binding protein